jgi:hypothetical protein
MGKKQMKKLAGYIVAVAAIALWTVSLYAQSAAPMLDGKWNVFVPMHEGMSLVLDLKQDGDKVAGSLQIEGHPELLLQGFFIEGQLTLKSNADAFMQVAFRGSFQDNGNLAGSLTSEMGNMNWTAERIH